ncbi:MULTISPECIES: nucleotidyltransferase [unclassified Paenibacillus]|uniref:nucleotidyltransferase n=1 Tax=unclassified Paenibacillus TaxID=185978 RepID=UPI002404C1C6|nr:MULTISPECIES: nucleotidyltransferase [unclassified Paenibacillus]MDF9839100.1 putative nucleotidyltransferase [Paenibacillus sp. PastF-2]MDF9845682.1 putative nucleotidyltransferase [Paenibacillus sp. PastM-2]MDF9852254.1 putative nucleotidyltransferase [Paenibacillus sp. PastF-1]MDH6478017.1 putative nucleotidyltransferase [Paenibacillus sp. PastH-2]MDH6505752.1 putative nucleotidyltransferase [Paenibacillus sp. PastM-3]
MTTVGIIAEYNPLHNGHVHHFNEAKRLTGADTSIVVMSGPFTQRGEPAAVSKQARTEMALHMGADLVLELPVGYALQPAEWFAFGAVSLLEATGAVDSLCFGSEAGRLSELLGLAEFLADESSELRGELHRRLALGASFPAAFSAAAAAVWSQAPGGHGSPHEAEALLRQPNNSLGLHYLIALRRLGSAIRPFTVPRTGAGFHDPLERGSSIASATAIRRLLLEGGAPAAYMPEYSMSILEREHAAGRGPVSLEDFRSQLRHVLITRTAEELRELQDMNEGLENRLLKVMPLLDQFTVSGLLEALKSKRYTHTRLQRLLVHALLNHSKAELNPSALAGGPGYIRVLGFRESGRTLLKKMKQTAAWPVVLSPAQFTHPGLDRDLRAAAAYAGAFNEPRRADLYADYLKPPVRI